MGSWKGKASVLLKKEFYFSSVNRLKYRMWGDGSYEEGTKTVTPVLLLMWWETKSSRYWARRIRVTSNVVNRGSKKESVVAFDVQRNSSPYTPKYHLLEHNVSHTQRFGTQPDFCSSAHKNLDVLFKKAYEKNFAKNTDKGDGNASRDGR